MSSISSRYMRLLLPVAMLGSLSPLAAQDDAIVVIAPNAQEEIERIILYDHQACPYINTPGADISLVVDHMRGIERGHAPDDFWERWEAHIEAWERLAREESRSRRDLQREVAARGRVGNTYRRLLELAWDYNVDIPREWANREDANRC